jgi:tetratricopeptide (TPR) repeat protein
MSKSFTFFALTLCLLCALFAGCHGDPNTRRQLYVQSGEKYFNQGKFKEAAIQFSNALRIDKNSAEAHHGLAQTYVQLGQFTAAYQELQRTVQLAPADAQARLDLASILLAGGQIEAAEKEAQIVSSAQPNDPGLHALLSALARQKGQNNTALAEIRRALQLDPNRPAYHLDLALLLMDDPSQSLVVEDELKRAISLNPKLMNGRLVLVSLYEKQQRWPEAEQAGESAIAADRESVPARLSLARTLLRENQQTRAEDVLRQGSRDLDNTTEGIRMLADYYVNSGQVMKASQEFARISTKFPKDLPLQESYAWALLQANENAKASKLIGDLRKNNPADPSIDALTGIVQLNNGQPSEAVNTLLNALKNSPDNATLQYWLGRAALAKGDMALAERSFREAARINPAWLAARQEMARLAALRGDMNLLFEVASQTIEQFPNTASGFVWRAIAEMNQDSPERAESDLRAALRVSPDNADVLLQLGKLRFAQKRFAEGTGMLEEVLRRDPVCVEAMRLLVARDLLQNKPQKALARLKDSLAAHPESSALHDILARLQAHMGNLDEAALAAQAAMRINPNDADAVVLLAEIEAKRGQVPNAIVAWEQWLRTHPRDASAMAFMGTLEEARGSLTAAESHYRKALQIQPSNAIAANNFAYLLLQSGGNVDVALTAAQTARQALPDSPNTADTLAWAYYHKGIYTLARDLLEEALRTAPTNPTLHFHLGMVYARLANKPQSALHLKRVLALAPNSTVAQQASQALKAVS